ncbi:hypothetical protein AGABI2DRAFT_78651, partial [Agaricus bisporus var. bisporus H97]|uniref:hypothetical protein n=1 Tax=Agaricus bisporus var. bisporus (strain H97 / ATCC MYA-4626 / FGSC 10389) TaxID=936046 RepID=UPI00029F5228
KRAETRQCPACDELIPLRLMARHAQLEAERVEEIIKQIGSSEPILLTDEFNDLSRPGPSTGARSRRSAIKALKAFTTSSPFSATNEQVIKTIQTIQKHRKQRHARFKEMAREDDEGYLRSNWARRNRTMNDEVICPICSRGVRGDQDVVDAHIDSCLADEARRSEEERVRRAAQEGQEDWMNAVDVVLPNGAVGHVGNIQGMGFHSRDPADQDVEDDIDIDGDDQDTYGEAQFTEGDILPVDEAHPAPVDEDVDVEIEGDQTDEADTAQRSLRDLIADSKVIVRQTTLREGSGSNSPVTLVGRVPASGDVERLDSVISNARQKNDTRALIAALEEKVQSLESIHVSSSASLLCRICLEQYSEPTVSTGCWHTCCRECWLRCLGSTKLCPICKRITGATDLRRVYL